MTSSYCRKDDERETRVLAGADEEEGNEEDSEFKGSVEEAASLRKDDPGKYWIDVV